MVPARDVDALSSALESVLFDEEFAAVSRANVQRVRERFTWTNTLAPLVDFVRDPHHARDYSEQRLAREGAASRVGSRRRKQYGFTHNVRLVAHHLRNGGPRVVLAKVAGRLRSR